jgi:hypothetical protein
MGGFEVLAEARRLRNCMNRCQEHVAAYLLTIFVLHWRGRLECSQLEVMTVDVKCLDAVAHEPYFLEGDGRFASSSWGAFSSCTDFGSHQLVPT